jgi:hypothetical protein
MPFSVMYAGSGLCISPIFVSRLVLEMQNWYRTHIGNARIKSTHRWIANIIVLLIILCDLGDVSYPEYWRKCVDDQETLTGILVIIITVEMIDKFLLCSMAYIELIVE